MNRLSAKRTEAQIAEQKLLIMRQQTMAAALSRSGQTEKARAARGKLLALLYELDLMQALGLPRAPAVRRSTH